MKSIILTGGGTAGHITPNIALIPGLVAEGLKPVYIGSRNGPEEKLIGETGVKFYGIHSGKFRRYISFRNLSDIFTIIAGFFEALISAVNYTYENRDKYINLGHVIIKQFVE